MTNPNCRCPRYRCERDDCALREARPHAHHKHAVHVGRTGQLRRARVVHVFWCEVCGATRASIDAPRDERNWRLPVPALAAGSPAPLAELEQERTS